MIDPCNSRSMTTVSFKLFAFKIDPTDIIAIRHSFSFIYDTLIQREEFYLDSKDLIKTAIDF